MDQEHPATVWLKAINRSASWLSKQLKYASPATASRWIRGDRHPAPGDQEAIAEMSKGPDGKSAVPVSIWHEWAIKRVKQIAGEISEGLRT